jgi:hypothetical protein
LLSRSARERLLPLLLVGTLLLCHGAFGSLHQISNVAFLEHPTIEHSSHQEDRGPADDHPAGAPDYAAALFALLLGMVYMLLRRETRDSFPPLPLAGRLPTTRIFHLPRGPGPPLFQVFRL